MANIALRATAFRVGRSYRVRAATAQASTGQTDWIAVPTWAKYARIVYGLTTVTGTTPTATPTLLATSNPANAHLDDNANAGVPASTAAIPPTDSVVVQLGGAVLTSGFTAAGTAVISVGPGVTGIANDVALGTSGVTYAYINDVLPEFLGISVVNDRDDNDEVYTYTVDVMFRD